MLTNANLSVVAPSLSISCQLPDAFSGVAYSGSCKGTGGIPPLMYQLSFSQLPPGLILNSSTGAITGTAPNPSTSKFEVEVTDSAYPIESSAVFTESNFVVKPGPLVISCSLPGASTGAYYFAACSTLGGTSPAAFSISSGALPAGLYMDFTGHVSGYASYSGSSLFTVQATDSGSPPEVSHLNQSIAVTVGPLLLHCTTFYGASVSAPFNASCLASGGTPPFLYSIASGALPAGLSLNSSTGAVSGVPTTASANNSFTVKASDSSVPMQTAFAQVLFNVQATSPLTLTCSAQNLTGNIGVPYPGFCPFTGGNQPYTASIVSGTLPAGLSVDAPVWQTTPSLVYLIGTPSAMGTTTVTLNLTDGSVPAMSTTAQATITIGPRPLESVYVTITATSGGITNTTKVLITVP